MTNEAKSLLEERLEFWKQISDDPRKGRVHARAKMLLASAGDVTKMDRASLESFRVELIEGVAVVTTMGGVADVERPVFLKPLQDKLEAVEHLLRSGTFAPAVNTGMPHPPPEAEAAEVPAAQPEGDGSYEPAGPPKVYRVRRRVP